MRRYREWYGVRSVFFDRAASGVERVAHYAALAESARQAGVRLSRRHGTAPAPEFARHCDLLGTFEGPWPAFRDAEVPSWVHDLPADWFFNLVYAVAPALHRRIAVWPPSATSARTVHPTAAADPRRTCPRTCRHDGGRC